MKPFAYLQQKRSTSLSFYSFCKGIRTKRFRHTGISVHLFFVHELRATSLSRKGVATWTVCLIFGWCGTSSVSHSLSERLTSGRTVLSLNPKIEQVQVVKFNGAGFIWYYHCTRKVREVFHCKGDSPPLVFRPLCEDCLKIYTDIIFLVSQFMRYARHFAANEEKELSLCSARQKRLYEQILIYFVELIEN